MPGERVVCWFSCGAASAVAAKRTIERHGAAACVVYCDTLSTEHPDNARFMRDVEAWIGQPIRVIRSERYPDIDAVFEKRRYMSGVAGAICTTELKKKPREVFQRETDTHVFGYTSDEAARAERFEQSNPALHVEWILIELGISKAACLAEIEGAGIDLPEMYRLGFDHNNCLGCVKAQSPGYWNKTRRLFPEVFARRARQSRLIGARLARVNGERVFLDELPEDADAPDDAIDCGPICQRVMPWG